MKKIYVKSRRQKSHEKTIVVRVVKSPYEKKVMQHSAYRLGVQIPSTKNFDCSPAGIKRTERCGFADSQLSEAAITIRECLGKTGD